MFRFRSTWTRYCHRSSGGIPPDDKRSSAYPLHRLKQKTGAPERLHLLNDETVLFHKRTVSFFLGLFSRCAGDAQLLQKLLTGLCPGKSFQSSAYIAAAFWRKHIKRLVEPFADTA